MAKGVRIKASEMSKQGKSYDAANGGKIANLGQQFIHVTTNEGRQGWTKCQVGEVRDPLMSVSQICDQGNTVQFDSAGGWIHNLIDKSWTRFERRHNVFELDLWLTSSDACGETQEATGKPGFTRPGQ